MAVSALVDSASPGRNDVDSLFSASVNLPGRFAGPAAMKIPTSQIAEHDPLGARAGGEGEDGAASGVHGSGPWPQSEPSMMTWAECRMHRHLRAAQATSEDMPERARLVGLNHVALEVGDLEEALAFYGRIFELELRGRVPGMAFIDIGDQFIALSEGRTQPPDRGPPLRAGRRRSRGRSRRASGGGRRGPSRTRGRLSRSVGQPRADRRVRRTSSSRRRPACCKGMGLEGLRKRPEALRELLEKGLD